MPDKDVPLTMGSLTSSSPLPLATAWLLADCMEYRGKQALWSQRTPEVLAALREQAIIQSVESSNRIEGVTVFRHAILGQVGPFTLAELGALVSSASRPLLKKTLAAMKKAGQVRSVGHGRAARWEVV